MRPPIRFDVSQKTILGVSYRAIVVMALAIGLAIGAVGGLRELSVVLRVGLAVLCIGLGLALAFGEIHGKTPEAWLWDVLAFRRRTRFFLHRAVRIHAEDPVAWAPTTPAPSVSVTGSTAVAALPNFFLLSANAIGLAVITMLSVWLAQGGAHQLVILLRPF